MGQSKNDKHHNSQLAHLKDLKEVRSLEGDIIKLSQQKQILELEVEDLRKEFDKECAFLKKVLSDERTNMENDLKSIKEKNDKKLEDETKKISQHLDEVKNKKLGEIYRLEDKIQDKKQTLKEIQNECATLTQDQITINQQITEDMHERNNLSVSVYNLQVQQEAYKEKLENEYVQYNRIITKSQLLFKKIEHSKEMLNSFQHEAALLKKRTKIKNKEHKKLDQKIIKQNHILNHSTIQAQKSSKKLDIIKASLDEKRTKLKLLADELNIQQQNLQGMIEQHTFIKVQNKEMLKSKKEIQKYLETMTLEKIAIENKLRLLKEEFEYGQKKYTELNKEKIGAEASIQLLKSKKVKLKERINHLEEESENLVDKNNDLFQEAQSASKELESKKYLKTSLQEEIVNLENKKCKLYPITHELEVKSNNMRLTIEKLDNNIKEKAQKVVGLKNTQNSLREEIERLDQLKQNHLFVTEKLDSEISSKNEALETYDHEITKKQAIVKEAIHQKEILTEQVESIAKQSEVLELQVEQILIRYEKAKKDYNEEVSKINALKDESEKISQDNIKLAEDRSKLEQKFEEQKQEFKAKAAEIINDEKNQFKEKVFEDVIWQLKPNYPHDQIKRIKQKENYSDYLAQGKQKKAIRPQGFWLGFASSAALLALYISGTFFYPKYFPKVNRNVASITLKGKNAQIDYTLLEKIDIFLVQQLKIEEKTVQIILEHETQFLEDTAQIKHNLNPHNKEIELQKLRILEVENDKRIKIHFREPAQYNQYKHFVRNYYQNK